MNVQVVVFRTGEHCVRSADMGEPSGLRGSLDSQVVVFYDGKVHRFSLTWARLLSCVWEGSQEEIFIIEIL